MDKIEACTELIKGANSFPTLLIATVLIANTSEDGDTVVEGESKLKDFGYELIEAYTYHESNGTPDPLDKITNVYGIRDKVRSLREYLANHVVEETIKSMMLHRALGGSNLIDIGREMDPTVMKVSLN